MGIKRYEVPDRIMAKSFDFDAAEQMGHVLRSQMLDQFALVEKWIVHSVQDIGEKHCKAALGQKLKFIRESCDQFKNPKRIERLADKIEAAICLRNEIVHAILETVIGRNGDPLWLFSNVGVASNGLVPKQSVITAEHFRDQLTALKRLVKELNDQPLKPPGQAAPAASSATASAN